MKRQFGKLSQTEQEKVELEYHQMDPAELDGLMSRATLHAPDFIQLPPQLVKSLKIVAESEGETQYQMMVQRWVEERLQQEIKLAS